MATEPEKKVIDLMQALMDSLERAKEESAPQDPNKPNKRKAQT